MERAVPARRTRWRTLVPIAGLALVLAVLALTLDLRRAFAAVAAAERAAVLAAAGLALGVSALAAGRLWLFLRAAALPRAYRRCWSAVMASLTLNAVLPARGGDLIKAAFLDDRQRPALGPLLGVTLVERAFDVLLLAALALAGALARGSGTLAWIAGAVAAAVAAALWALGRAHRLPAVGDRLGGLAAAVRAILRRPGWLALAVGCALLSWLLVLALFHCLLVAVGLAVAPAAIASAVPLAILVGVLPVSIAGLGTRDGALVLLLHHLAEPERVLAAGLLYTVVGYWFLALVGVAALGRETLRRARRRAAAGDAGPLRPPAA